MPPMPGWMFALLFLAMWLGVGAMLAEMSGWSTLSRRYRVSARPDGRRLRSQVVMVGAVSERGVTHLIVGPAGLYLYANLLFRFRRPSLLVPWSAIHFVTERRLWWRRWYEFDIGGTTTLGVRGKAYESIVSFLRHPHHSSAA
jgi:hypothetical protein